MSKKVLENFLLSPGRRRFTNFQVDMLFGSVLNPLN